MATAIYVRKLQRKHHAMRMFVQILIIYTARRVKASEISFSQMARYPWQIYLKYILPLEHYVVKTLDLLKNVFWSIKCLSVLPFRSEFQSLPKSMPWILYSVYQNFMKNETQIWNWLTQDFMCFWFIVIVIK
jgi:hypothetical protein